MNTVKMNFSLKSTKSCLPSRVAGRGFLVCHLRLLIQKKSISKLKIAGMFKLISFKVRSVQINRPWVDPAAFTIENYTIPGVSPGAWSNKGVFPLLTTQLIVAKDIKVTAAKFSKEIVDTLNKFETSTQVGVATGKLDSKIKHLHKLFFDYMNIGWFIQFWFLFLTYQGNTQFPI